MFQCTVYTPGLKYGPDAEKHEANNEEQAELKRLRKELQRGVLPRYHGRFKIALNC